MNALQIVAATTSHNAHNAIECIIKRLETSLIDTEGLRGSVTALQAADGHKVLEAVAVRHKAIEGNRKCTVLGYHTLGGVRVPIVEYSFGG